MPTDTGVDISLVDDVDVAIAPAARILEDGVATAAWGVQGGREYVDVASLAKEEVSDAGAELIVAVEKVPLDCTSEEEDTLLLLLLLQTVSPAPSTFALVFTSARVEVTSSCVYSLFAR